MHYLRIIVVFLFIGILSTKLFAQNSLRMGVYTLGGSVGLSLANHEDDFSKDKFTFITVEPSFGYFITNNLLINGRLSFDYSENEYFDKTHGPSYNSIYRFYEVGVGIRYYFNSETIIPFVGVGIFYSKQYNAEMDGKGITVSAGINYFLSKEVALEPNVSYLLSSYNMYGQTYNAFRVGISVNYYIIQ